MQANAQSIFERLVMPGDLIEGHADLQKDCSNCHEDFTKGAQIDLCLDCHKDVAKDLNDRMGFHGRSVEAQALECSHCHTDHKGRDFQVVLLDKETFDHNQTDFKVEGAHIGVDCVGCHKPDAKFRTAPSACFDCHKEDDRHNEKLGKECADCHNTKDWADLTAFDHSKTDFPLTNAHKDVTCTSCHVAEKYEDLPLTCVGCHRIQDVHEDRFGEKCEDCHTNTKWTEIRFDHDKDTEFRLDGAHKTTGCNDCHSQNVFKHPQATDCISCHKADDTHRGALGARCEDCHSTTDWLTDVFFDHDFTTFPLIGQHAVVPCEGCHIDTTFQIDTSSGCQGCHAKDDVHGARLGPECEACHNPNGWEFWLFDHNSQTQFSLTGKHVGVKCESCHTKPVNGPPEQSRACISCHRRDDVHRGSFGTQCSSCHSTSSFKGARLK